MSRGLGELQREIKDTLTFLWNHKQSTQFANLRTCFLVRRRVSTAGQHHLTFTCAGSSVRLKLE